MAISRDQLLAEARRAWEAYTKPGADEDYVAARNAGITLAEIRDQ